MTTAGMNGVLTWGVYLPYRRLDRSSIAAVAGAGGGKGTRTVASYDEDTTTMGVEAARLALRGSPASPSALWFASANPAYQDKTNATAVHAALHLARSVPAYDALGAVRSTLGALRAGLSGSGPALVVAADLRTGLPGGPDETGFGDGAAAVLVGSAADGPLAAEVVAWATSTEEFLDRWRTPGEIRSKVWEERFGETRYGPLAKEAFHDALAQAGIDAGQVDLLVVAGTHARACAAAVKATGVPGDRVVDDLAATVGNTGAAQPLVLLAAALERAQPGQRIVLLTLADGADCVILQATGDVARAVPNRTVASLAAEGAPLPYGKYLAWRGVLPIEPPRRPEPARVSASAAARATDWKFGFIGSEAGGEVHLPPGPSDTTARPMADTQGTIVTFTVDRLAYSPSPPVVFAVVDFDGGGRLPVELTDVDPAELAIGARVELTFRKLFTSDGIHNYFWKARLIRS